MSYKFFFPENDEMSFVVFMSKHEFSKFTHQMYSHTESFMALGEKVDGVFPVIIYDCKRSEFLFLLNWLQNNNIL